MTRRVSAGLTAVLVGVVSIAHGAWTVGPDAAASVGTPTVPVERKATPADPFAAPLVALSAPLIRLTGTIACNPRVRVCEE